MSKLRTLKNTVWRAEGIRLDVIISVGYRVKSPQGTQFRIWSICLSGSSIGGWVDYGQQLQEAGANALELNCYYLAANAEESSADVENRYLEILQELKSVVSLPITMKLSSQFSSPKDVLR